MNHFAVYFFAESFCGKENEMSNSFDNKLSLCVDDSILSIDLFIFCVLLLSLTAPMKWITLLLNHIEKMSIREWREKKNRSDNEREICFETCLNVYSEQIFKKERKKKNI